MAKPNYARYGSSQFLRTQVVAAAAEFIRQIDCDGSVATQTMSSMAVDALESLRTAVNRQTGKEQ